MNSDHFSLSKNKYLNQLSITERYPAKFPTNLAQQASSKNLILAMHLQMPQEAWSWPEDGSNKSSGNREAVLPSACPVEVSLAAGLVDMLKPPQLGPASSLGPCSISPLSLLGQMCSWDDVEAMQA